MNNFNRLRSIFDNWLVDYGQISGLFPLLEKAAQSALKRGGKRFRPVLCLTVGEVLGVAADQLQPYALALELIHAASLVHDDLPGLDNSDERRGHPSVHKEFGEAAAILTGDLLISEAFRVIAESPHTGQDVKIRWISELTRSNALICSGQLREITAQIGGVGSGEEERSGIEHSRMVIEEKTAALIRASVLGGPALLGSHLEAEKRRFWSDFGTKLGILFQLRDDQLDDDHGADYQRWGDTLLKDCAADIESNFDGNATAIKELKSLVEFVWGRAN